MEDSLVMVRMNKEKLVPVTGSFMASMGKSCLRSPLQNAAVAKYRRQQCIVSASHDQLSSKSR